VLARIKKMNLKLQNDNWNSFADAPETEVGNTRANSDVARKHITSLLSVNYQPGTWKHIIPDETRYVPFLYCYL